MSSTTTSSSGGFSIPWLLIFVIVKVWGSAFAAWSWWWVLLAIVPCVWVFLEKVGML